MLVASQIYCVIWSMWYKMLPVSVLAAAELNQSVRDSSACPESVAKVAQNYP